MRLSQEACGCLFSTRTKFRLRRELFHRFRIDRSERRMDFHISKQQDLSIRKIAPCAASAATQYGGR